MAKKMTLEMLATQIAKGFAKHGKEIHDLTESVAHVVKHMATKDDIADLRRELKGDVVAVGQQVASIETQLREMKHDKLVTRVTKLEGEVFGASRR